MEENVVSNLFRFRGLSLLPDGLSDLSIPNPVDLWFVGEWHDMDCQELTPSNPILFDERNFTDMILNEIHLNKIKMRFIRVLCIVLVVILE